MLQLKRDNALCLAAGYLLAEFQRVVTPAYLPIGEFDPLGDVGDLRMAFEHTRVESYPLKLHDGRRLDTFVSQQGLRTPAVIRFAIPEHEAVDPESLAVWARGADGAWSAMSSKVPHQPIVVSSRAKQLGAWVLLYNSAGYPQGT